MSLIDHIIPISALEVIRDKIYSILKSEFDNQLYQYNNTACQGVTFMAERTVPIDKVETDMITISTFQGSYANQSAGSQHAMPYSYVIDIITKSKTNPNNRGDELAAFRLHKLAMIVRYILMSPTYLTLKIDGIIEHTEVNKFQVYKDERSPDSSNIATGQLLFNVQCEEVSKANEGILLAGSDTSVRIELTEQGYMYTKESYEG